MMGGSGQSAVGSLVHSNDLILSLSKDEVAAAHAPTSSTLRQAQGEDVGGAIRCVLCMSEKNWNA
jgi:hypothetical protein